jgi:NAD(P)H-hydrate epimerase
LRDCIERVNRAGRPCWRSTSRRVSTRTAACHRARGTRDAHARFVALKSGYFLGAAPDYVGALELAGLGLPPDIRESATPLLRRMNESLAAAALPPRRRSAHKGEHGRVLVVGGFVMAGAARLAGEAALRTGAGLVTVATGEEDIEAIVAARPELIARPAASAANLKWLLAAADAVAIGPGLGTGREAHDAFNAAVASDRPLVVDADALNLLATDPRRRPDWILTPHPGEAARLLGCDAGSVQRDRLGAVRTISEKFGGVCVLKGHTRSCTDRGSRPGCATAATRGWRRPGAAMCSRASSLRCSAAACRLRSPRQRACSCMPKRAIERRAAACAA